MIAPDLPPPPPSPDHTPVELWRSDRVGASDLLLLCDHASNAAPAELGDLGLGAADLGRHIAYDVGARSVTHALSAAFDAPAALATFSRLVIDPNRGEDDPTLVMRLSDRSIVPANARIDAAGREARLARFHRPYHAAIARLLDGAQAAGRRPTVISIHSFTPAMVGGAPRPWHFGVLWRDDPVTAERLIALLRATPDVVVGDNQPYAGALEGDTISRHAAARGLPHAVIELRNDLIAAPEGQRAWANRLAAAIAGLLAQPASSSAASRA